MAQHTPPSSTQDRLLRCINAALQRKAKDLVVMKVKDLSSFADYFMICSGNSDRQVRAIAAWLDESLKKDGMIPLGQEGRQAGQWILMDYDDIVIHVFFDPIRSFYDLEGLWSDAPRMDIGEDTVEVAALREELAP